VKVAETFPELAVWVAADAADAADAKPADRAATQVQRRSAVRIGAA
jgi:hypothetical protein